MPGRLILRRLDDAAVVFDTLTWQTHVVPPAARVLCDLADECGGIEVATEHDVAEAIDQQLGIDPASPQVAQGLRMLRDIGLIQG